MNAIATKTPATRPALAKNPPELLLFDVCSALRDGVLVTPAALAVIDAELSVAADELESDEDVADTDTEEVGIDREEEKEDAGKDTEEDVRAELSLVEVALDDEGVEVEDCDGVTYTMLTAAVVEEEDVVVVSDAVEAEAVLEALPIA
ncbi:hypothetical protein YB2330_006505 [Saitoella coloradoensis]